MEQLVKILTKMNSFGGSSVLEMARNGFNVTGVVSFHGGLHAAELINNDTIGTKVLVLHGHGDPGAMAQKVQMFEEEMTKRNADWQVQGYVNHTYHAFTIPTANDPPQAKYQLVSDKRKKRSHRRQGSTASQISNKSNDSSATNEFAMGTDGTNLMHESPSFCGASLTFVDADSPTTTTSPHQEFPVSNYSQSDLGKPSITRHTQLKRKLCLSRSLSDVLNDPTPLGYFLTYMESKSLKHLVKFWLETETFRISATATHKRLMENDFQSSSSSKSTSSNLKQMTEQDAVAIFSKYLSNESAFDIGASESLRKQIIEKICPSDGTFVDPDCFAPAQKYIFDVLQNRYYPDYLQSVQYYKHVLEVLTEGSIVITDVLYDNAVLSLFLEFMEQEKQSNLLEFWMATQTFRGKLTMLNEMNNYDGEQAQNDAMVLYDNFKDFIHSPPFTKASNIFLAIAFLRYFSMQATCPLGFNDEVRIQIEDNISKDGGPSPDCFDKPVKYVLVILEEKYLPKFLNSGLYAKYLNELRNTAEHELELPSTNGRRSKKSGTGSDVSSAGRSSDTSFTNFLAKNNTLLAHESPNAIRRRHQLEAANGDLSIDSRSYDPDALWKRDKQKLALGYVDSVGRYVSSMEENPGHKRTQSGGGKIKVAMKKFISGDAKEKEELAEKMAALIVQDIQNMTCRIANGDDDGSLQEFA